MAVLPARHDQAPKLPPLPPIGAPKWTMIPDVVLDHYLSVLSHAELVVLLAILRETFGWRRTEIQLTCRQICNRTGLSRRSVRRATHRLAAAGVLTIIPAIHTPGAGGQTANRYRLNVEGEPAQPPIPTQTALEV